LLAVEPVSDREGLILRHLWRLRFLTAAQLAEFVFGGSAVTLGSRAVMTQRVLASLKTRAMVAVLPAIVDRPGVGEARPAYYLTAKGLRAARSVWPGPAPRQLRSSGAFLARHALATAETILSFRRAALAFPAHELVAWESDWQAALPLGSSLVEPDAYLLYRVGDERLHVLLEIDMGTEHTRVIAEKMRRYLDVHRAGSWRPRMPVWPIILVIAQTAARLVQLRRVCEAVSALPGGEWNTAASFHFATLAAVIGKAGPLGPIWQVLGSPDHTSLFPDELPRHAE
jgi:hypothetical protein